MKQAQLPFLIDGFVDTIVEDSRSLQPRLRFRKSTSTSGNYQETMKQLAGVFGYNYGKPESTKSNVPHSGYTRTTYGPWVQGMYAQVFGHTVPIRGADDMKFLGSHREETIMRRGEERMLKANKTRRAVA